MDEQLTETLLAYLRGELEEGETTALEQRLLEEDILRRQLLELSSEESALTDWAKSERALITLEDKAFENDAVPPAPSTTPSNILFFQKPWLAAAAAILIVGFTAIATFNRAPDKTATQGVARLVASVDADWHGETPQQNESLPAGSYELAQGSIDLQFADGANVSLGGPATFTLKSANHIHLERGNLVAQIPDEALGFIVTSPQSEVVDLGTEFGLAVSDEGQTDVHVLDGLVEVLPPSGAAPSPGVMISGGEARRFESDPSASPKKIPVTSREGLLGANPFSDLGLQMLRGSVRVTDVLSEADYTEKPSGRNWINLVAEQRGVTTSQPLEVTLKNPGNYRDFGDITATLPPGQKLNSYLLHFRPSSKKQVRGVIRFDQPIVGILCSRKHLSESDALFGLPTVYYPTNPGARGMEPDTFPTAWDTGMMPEWQPDELILSQDRRTICINTYGNPERGYDQVRVITKVPVQN